MSSQVREREWYIAVVLGRSSGKYIKLKNFIESVLQSTNYFVILLLSLLPEYLCTKHAEIPKKNTGFFICNSYTYTYSSNVVPVQNATESSFFFYNEVSNEMHH